MPTGPDYAAAKAENARLNLLETRAGQLALRSMPRYVMVELTQGCNLRCPMCRSRTIGYRERELDRDILASVAEILFPTAEVVDIRGWGESLLVPDIDAVIRQVDTYGARCRVVTNLSFNRPETLDLLVDVGAMVDISLDSAEQTTLDVCRPGARLGLIRRNIARLTGRLNAAARSADSLRILATLQRNTLADLPGLIRFAAEAQVRQVVLNEVVLAPGDPLAVVGHEDEVDRAVALAQTVADDAGVDLYAGTALGRCAGVRKDIEACIHPWSYVTVGYDGSVGYCDHLIGPMLPMSCMGAAWQALRRWHSSPDRADTPSYHACFRCYQHRNVDFEDVFEPRLDRYRLNLLPIQGR
jgi:MoaA/NifB/PqqE/SkfB family radical SAM enzyme